MANLATTQLPQTVYRGTDFKRFHILSTATLDADFGGVTIGTPIPLTGAVATLTAVPIQTDAPQIEKTGVVHPTITGRVDFTFVPADTVANDGTIMYKCEVKLVELSGAITVFDAPDLIVYETDNTGD